MATVTYQAIQYVEGNAISQADLLTEEEALYVHVNGKPFTVTMRTPGDDVELVRGIMNSEDICSPDRALCIERDESDKKRSIYNVLIDNSDLREGYKNSRNLLSVSSCGICGQTELCEVEGKVSDKGMISPSDLQTMFERMKEQQTTFGQTGGSHAAAVFDVEGELLSVKEDIGRHNAVDKVVGDILLKGLFKESNVLLVSGRISYEIVIKAFRAKIPVLAAVSAPSSLAVDYAKELGITLFGFCRGSKATCYANLHRVVKNENRI